MSAIAGIVRIRSRWGMRGFMLFCYGLVIAGQAGAIVVLDDVLQIPDYFQRLEYFTDLRLADWTPTNDPAGQACQAFVLKHNQPSVRCSTGPGGSHAGWLPDPPIPPEWYPYAPPGTKFYYGMFLNCDPGLTRFFMDVKNCVNVYLFPQQDPTLGDPKGNGSICQPTCGDPINPGNGNHWQTETDYAAYVQDGLALIRTYNSNSYSIDAEAIRSFGKRWTQSYEGSRLTRVANVNIQQPRIQCFQRYDNKQVFCEQYVPPAPQLDAVAILRPDGKKYVFNKTPSGWLNEADINDRVTAMYASDGTTIIGWAYVTAQGNATERFDANGLLISVTSRTGTVQRMTYSDGVTNSSIAGRMPADAPVCSHVQANTVLPAGRLLCVTDQWGRQLNFEQDIKGRIVKAVDPSGGIYLYEYDGSSGGCSGANLTSPACLANNLTKVTYPDGKTRIYYYNEAAQINDGAACLGAVAVSSGYGHLLNQLTGLIDENGNRYSTWRFDCQGRAIGNELAGGANKVALAYGTLDPTTGVATTVATYSVGDPAAPQTNSNRFDFKSILGVRRNIGSDVNCVDCGDTKSRTYDANGNIVRRIDWNGNVTQYAYDLSRNQEISRTEAAGTPQSRTITTDWHPTYRLPVSITEPGKVTTFTYDASGNLAQKAVAANGSSRTWNYTYNDVGQVLTAKGPRTDVSDITTYSYDSQGNLASVTNALGQVTTLSNYDANGRVGRIADANGLTTELSYSPRGWLTSKSVGGETTSYEYDGVGQLTKVTLPDSSAISYTYDDAHRLTHIADSLGNSIAYTLDLMGNRIKEQVTDPSGTLARQTTRIYDALNRLQQVTGGLQ